jgi:hypothetical protein
LTVRPEERIVEGTFGGGAMRDGDVGRRTRAVGGIGRLLVAIGMMGVLVGVSAPVATAAEESRKPIVREQIDETIVEEIDQFALDVCGVELRLDGRVRGQFVLYGDNTARTHLNIEFVWSDPDTGEVVFIERDAETFFDVPISESVDEDAGTLTLVFERTITGLPLKGMVPQEGVLLRDAGRLTLIATVVLDLETGEELSVDEEILDVRGPHPFLELSPAERDELFCDVVTG